jgi:hypothetical protein
VCLATQLASIPSSTVGAQTRPQGGDFVKGSEASISVIEQGMVVLSSLEAKAKALQRSAAHSEGSGSMDSLATEKTHLYIVVERQSGTGTTADKSHSAAVALRNCFSNYGKVDCETNTLAAKGKVVGMWACPNSGGDKSRSWCWKSGKPTRGDEPYHARDLSTLAKRTAAKGRSHWLYISPAL